MLILSRADCDPNVLDNTGASPCDYTRRDGLWPQWHWVLKNTEFSSDPGSDRRVRGLTSWRVARPVLLASQDSPWIIWDAPTGLQQGSGSSGSETESGVNLFNLTRLNDAIGCESFTCTPWPVRCRNTGLIDYGYTAAGFHPPKPSTPQVRRRKRRFVYSPSVENLYRRRYRSCGKWDPKI